MKKKNKWWLCVAPLYIFTLLFALGPMIYMVAVSFATNNGDGYGFTWLFTTENFKKMLDPVYLDCFLQSFKLAFSTTLIVIAIGYPFGYFMAKLSERQKADDVFNYGTVLDKLSYSSLRMDYYFTGERYI